MDQNSGETRKIEVLHGATVEGFFGIVTDKDVARMDNNDYGTGETDIHAEERTGLYHDNVPRTNPDLQSLVDALDSPPAPAES